MSEKNKRLTFFQAIRAFFPFHLFFYQLKHNIIVVLYWLILFAILNGQLGENFGLYILFFSPEYLDAINSISFALLGFACGGFIVAFNTYSYIKLGQYFPFLATLKRPFLKFFQNNSLIPLIFIVFYLVKMIQFQVAQEYATTLDIIFFSFSFLGGMSLFFVLSFLYFIPIAKTPPTAKEGKEKDLPYSSILHKEKRVWYRIFFQRRSKRFVYIGQGFRFLHSRKIDHFSPVLIEKVLARNKVNTSIFEVMTICMFLLLGFFSSVHYFETPAAVSILLLFTIVLMLFSALQSWFGKWTYVLIISIFLGINHLSTTTPFFKFKNYAYGLNYENKPKLAPYSISSIQAYLQHDKNNSFQKYQNTLDNWKAKTGKLKPKLIIVNVSGGGSRSALWTLSVLQKTDSILEGKIQQNTQLITGASGGMIGAAFFRELQLRHHLHQIESVYSRKYSNQMGKDLLNKLSFSASTNDLFFRYQHFEYNGISYPKDRGYAFEEQLHENTASFMEHSLGYYQKYEQSGLIPTMIFSPTIVNDGRRLLISSQSLQFLCRSMDSLKQVANSLENIDYQTFFKNAHPNDLRFSTVMRSSATFPFVMPMVTMPTTPGIQLMDAGIRDNYGGKVSMEFLYKMHDWIKENTSGIILLQIRDTKKVIQNEMYHSVSLMDKLKLPFGNIFRNFPRTQDFDMEQLLKVGTQQLDFPVDIISFNLREKAGDKIALSWHLTGKEKRMIERAYLSEYNQLSIKRLQELLE